MTMLISFLPNFIGRRDCNAGGRHCDVEQLAARLAHNQEVAGSIPVRSTKNAAHRFRLAKFVQPRFFHRGIIPLLTLFFSASGSQKTAVTPCGGISSLAVLVNHEGKRKFSSPT